MKYENVHWVLKILKFELVKLKKKFVQIFIFELTFSIINQSTIKNK